MFRLLISLTLAFTMAVSCNQAKTDMVAHDNDSRAGYKNSASPACPDFAFESAQQQADTLVVFMNNAKRSPGMAVLEQKFFCAFPNSFDEMQAIFGYDNDRGAAPLYESGADVIRFFADLKFIPSAEYYRKYINININGIWEADNIRDAFHFSERLSNDTKAVCTALSKFTDREIKSVFRFIFDGPHPANKYNKQIFSELLRKIESEDVRLARLLTEAFNEVLATDDGHGR